MVAAMVLPVLIVITGILMPFGLAGDDPLNFDRIHSALSQPLIKLIMFTVISLLLFHWAHRFFFTLVDVGLNSVINLIAVLCYVVAID